MLETDARSLHDDGALAFGWVAAVDCNMAVIELSGVHVPTRLQVDAIPA